MKEWTDSAIVLNVRPHGETGGVVSLLTEKFGRCLGYVYGARGSKMRGILEPGTAVSAAWHAKTEDQLGSFALELEKSPAALVFDDPLKLMALQSAAALADRTLAEREPHPAVYRGFRALLDAFDSDVWPAAYIYWEMGLLRDLGFGIDLAQCAVTKSPENLRYVSPKSGIAVSEEGAGVYKDRLLKLPGFLTGGGYEGDQDAYEGLRLTGHFLQNRIFAPANMNIPEVRRMLEERFKTG